MIESKVSLASFTELLSNGSNGQFIAVALDGNLNNLVYVGKVENLIDELSKQYFVTSVCSDLVMPDLIKLVMQQKFKLDAVPDTGDSIMVIGVNRTA